LWHFAIDKKREEVLLFLNKTRNMVYMGLFVSLEIVFTRFLSYQGANVRIGLGFLPVALAAITFGPIYGGLTGALADVIRMALFPMGTAYFPGLTISAFLSGAIYGILLHNKPKSYLRITITVLIITLFIDLGLNTFWLTILLKKTFFVLVIDRIISNTIMFPIRIIMIYLSWKYLGDFIESNILKKTVSATK